MYVSWITAGGGSAAVAESSLAAVETPAAERQQEMRQRGGVSELLEGQRLSIMGSALYALRLPSNIVTQVAPILASVYSLGSRG